MSLVAAEQQQQEDIQRDRPLLPWRVPVAANSAALLVDVVRMLASIEERQRQRRPEDQRRYERLVTAVVMDTLYHFLMQRPGELMVSRSGRVLNMRSRYIPDFYTRKTLPPLLDLMTEVNLLNQHKGQPGRKTSWEAYLTQTTITIGPALVHLAQRHRVTLGDIGENREGQEVVLLKGDNDADDDNLCRFGNLVEYHDTDQTRRIREEMREINARTALVNVSLRPGVNFGRPIDLRDRHQRRHFTKGDVTFTSGGRLFGGFWQEMRKAERFDGLLFRGRRCVELDYSAILPRLLYGTTGASLPEGLEGDPYRIAGYERSREGIKKVFGAMLFGEDLDRWTAYPREAAALFHPEECRPIQVVFEAIRKAHHPVGDHFGMGLGHRLQNLESTILVKVLLRLLQSGADVLSIHDAVLVSRDDTDEARTCMLEYFKKLVGIEGRVTIRESA
jgi:hypothetical protein